MTIRSNPPGALAYVDNIEIGRTPCATDFTYYGTRQIKLVRDGYETLTVNQPIPTPWYEIPPLDFVSENLLPGRIRDTRALSYNLTPQTILPTEQLLSRAGRLREGARMDGPIQPVPAASPGVLSPAPTGPVTPSAPAGGVETLPAPAGAGPLQPLPAGSAPGPAGPETLPPRGTPPIYAPPPLPDSPR